MTPAEAQMLLGIAASFDNRKPSEEAAVAWSHALDGIRFQDARDAIVAHYTETTDWLMPPHIVTRVKRIRAKRLADIPSPTPPPDLTPLQTIEWLKGARRRIADGESVDDVAAYGELKPRNLPDLKALIRRPTPQPEATRPEANDERREAS